MDAREPGPNRLGRRGLWVVGAREETLAWAQRATAELAEREVLWVSAREGGVTPSALAGLLGVDLSVVVLDAHDGLDPDALGRCHGFVRGGGALIVRAGPELPTPEPRLAAWPFDAGAVGLGFEVRARRILAETFERVAPEQEPRLTAAPRVEAGTAEQAGVVEALVRALTEPGMAVALLADRGRGKSVALGLTASRLMAAGKKVALTAASPVSAAEVTRFAPALSWVPPEAVPRDADIVFVDEAATLGVPVLRRMVAERASSFAFATTTHGYEGTGRGFALRFLPWLGTRRPMTRMRLLEPIRWSLQRTPVMLTPC